MFKNFLKNAILGIERMHLEFTGEKLLTLNIKNEAEFLDSVKEYLRILTRLVPNSEKQYLVLVSRYSLSERGKIHPSELSISRQRVHQMWQMCIKEIGAERMKLIIKAAELEANGEKEKGHLDLKIKEGIPLRKYMQQVRLRLATRGIHSSAVAVALIKNGYLDKKRMPTEKGVLAGIALDANGVVILEKQGERLVSTLLSL